MNSMCLFSFPDNKEKKVKETIFTFLRHFELNVSIYLFQYHEWAVLTHYSFSKSKYFHLMIDSADIRIYLYLDNEIDRKIDVTAIPFLMVLNRHQTHD